jgi:amino acid transporter
MMHLSNKKLTLFHVAFLTITANFGIRWLAVAGGIGPSALFFWLIGAILFFVPLTIISGQMAVAYPQEGGVYVWVREILGEKFGFIVAWFYWLNNVFFYPAILIFLVSNFSYFLGKPQLANNVNFITITSLVFFWSINIISLFGIRATKNFITTGGIVGLLIPTVLLIVTATYLLMTGHQSATTFTFNSLKPSHTIISNISSLAILMFAMSGIEIIPTFANSVSNIKKDLFLGLILGSVIIFLLYFIGTVAINVSVTPEDIQKASGIIYAFSIIDNKLGISSVTRVIAFVLTFAEFGALTIWIIAPVIIFFKSTPKGVLPDWLHKTNKYGTPNNAIIFQGLIVTIIILLSNFIQNVNIMYQALIIMATILYFIPYLLLAMIYIKAQIKSNIYIKYLLFILLLISVLFGIVVSFVPTPDLKTTHDIIIYECEIIFGPLFFIIIGILLSRHKAINKKQ